MRGAALALLLVACAPTATPPASTPAPSPTATSAATATPSRPPADAALRLVLDGLASPVAYVTAPGRPGDGLLVSQLGTVSIVRDGKLLAELFLDLRDRLVELDRDYDERGLLNLAFHPDFASNGRFFVYYSAPLRADAPPPADHVNRLSELRLDPANPDRADPVSERIILEFEQPQPNHSGGGLAFGPDGHLYLATGDGGGQGDASEGHSAQGNAQDPAKLHGKVLRFDVDAASPEPELWAWGFRNPYRLSWEPDGDRRLLVGDVGYGRWEEVDVVVRGGNYGWRMREGAHCLDIERPLEDVTGCPTTGVGGEPLIDPVIEYAHEDVGIAVIGGFVYRGSALAALQGDYVFADFTADWSGDTPRPRPTILAAEVGASGGATWPWRRLEIEESLAGSFILGLGEDAAGELYVMTRETIGPSDVGGRLLRMISPGEPPATPARRCCALTADVP